jgi:hypothetical protein
VIAGEGEASGSVLKRILIFIYVLAMIYMYNMHHIRLRASGAFQYFDFNNILHTGGWFNWHWWGQVHGVPMAQGSTILHSDKVLSFHALYQLEMFGAYSKTMGPASQILEAFSLADATNARNRDIFKGVLIGLLIALILGMPIFLYAMHRVGYDNTPQANKEWNDHFVVSDKAYRYYTKYNPAIFTSRSIWWVVFGAALYGTCMYLRREYARFPIEPMGLLIAGTYGGRCSLGVDRIWFTFIIALFVKWIIFRWYGVRAFQEKVVPFLVYCLMGMSLGIMLYLFLSAILVTRGVMSG